MSLTQKIKNTLNESKEFLQRNKNTLALAGAMLTSSVAVSQGHTRDYVSTPENVAETKRLVEEEKERLKTLELQESEFQQELTETKSETLYSMNDLKQMFRELPEHKQSALVYTWYLNADDTKLEEIALDSQRILNKSGGIVTLANPEIKYHDDQPYVSLAMDNFRDKDRVTTFFDMFNRVGSSDAEIKDVLNLYANWAHENMTVVRDQSGSSVTVDYTGTNNKDIIAKRPTNLGVVEYPRWVPGTTADFQLDGVLDMGYNIRAIDNIAQNYGVSNDIELDAQTIESYARFAQDAAAQLERERPEGFTRNEYMDYLNEEIDDLKAENKELGESYSAMTQTADSLRTESKGLRNFIAGLNAGPTIFMNSAGEPGYGLTVGRGIGKNNRTLSLTGIYSPEKTTETYSPEVVERSETTSELFETTWITEDRVSEWATTTTQSAKALLGFEVIDNLSILGGVKYTDGLRVDNKKVTEYQAELSTDGMPITENLDVNRTSTSTNISKFEPVVGLNYMLLDNKLGVSVTYDFDKAGFNTKNFNIGVNYNITTKE